MKRYRGDRTIDGIEVTVDGRPLEPRYDIAQLTRTGFEWTYEGQGPAQLALALLADHLGDDHRALALHRPFMSAIVANLGNEWELSEADLAEAVAALEGGAEQSGSETA